jgi:tetratricopeptide (TPR) repeat protein
MKRIAFLIILLALCSAALHSGPTGSTSDDAGLKALLSSSDVLTSKLNYDEARRVLEQANVKYPGNSEVLWRLSSLLINIGDVLSDKIPAYQKAVEYGKASVKADYNNSNAHAFLAAAYGSYAMFAGSKEKVKLANMIRSELDISLKLDQNNQVAHSIYGTWHREVAEVNWIERKLADVFLGGLPKGSLQESEYHLQQAIRIAPNVFRHHFELGMTYAAGKRDILAIKSLETALRCPNDMKADAHRKVLARQLLGKLKS